MIPEAKSVVRSAVQPWLTKGSGKPESGMRPSIEAIFMNAAVVIITTSPTVKDAPNASGALAAI